LNHKKRVQNFLGVFGKDFEPDGHSHQADGFHGFAAQFGEIFVRGINQNPFEKGHKVVIKLERVSRTQSRWNAPE
jgi:hypothetical protein